MTRHQTPGLKPAFGRDTRWVRRGVDRCLGKSGDGAGRWALGLRALVLLAEVGRSMFELVTKEEEESGAERGGAER